MNRKQWLKSIGLSGLAMSAGSFSILKAESPKSQSKRVMRIAHMTDPHVHPDNNSESWTKICIDHIHSLEDKPDIIFNGGDTIGDALSKDEQTVINQWEVWNRLAKSIELPVVHCIGNHDVWGTPEYKTDPRYAKNWAVTELELPNRYYDFEMNGWHFLVLDSTHIKEDGSWYTAKLDKEQFQWLQDTLNSIPETRPVFIFSHIPIMCAASFFDGDNEKSGNWQIPGAWVHIDARKIVELFYTHSNVKLAISGHIHLLDTVVYNNVTYYCDGAVSGGWWGGNYHQTFPGYALINLYEDGSFDREYVAYGWKE
jgi:3',5'-cyclic-AMP phosphodiesterase